MVYRNQHRFEVLLVCLGIALGPWPSHGADSAAPGPKRVEFERLFSDWKKLLGELRDLRDRYREAQPAQRPPIEQRYNELLQKGQQMQPKVMEAAEAAFREDPRSTKEAAEFLLGAIYLGCRDDQYEEALRVAKLLLDHQHPEPMLHAWAGVAAFCAGEFDLAAEHLKRAQERNLFDRLGGDFPRLAPMMLAEIPFYKEAWAKEQSVRSAEAKADDLPRVLLQTTKGDIEVELFENEAPNTVANFISLVEKGFYNGTPFHRVLRQFMAQGGDPTGTGAGGPGYSIPCECYQANYRVHFRGSLSMAHAGRDTGGSQFFLTFRPTHHLDGKHTVFGRVIKGMEVLGKLQRRNPDDPDAPEPDKILQAKVLRKRNHPYEPKKVAKDPTARP